MMIKFFKSASGLKPICDSAFITPALRLRLRFELKSLINYVTTIPALRLRLGSNMYLQRALALINWIKLSKVILFFLLVPNLVNAQTKPAFWDDIRAFKKQDSAHFPGVGKILFVGSSSFTKWTDVQDYFPSYPIINRGFGGSTLTDQIRYVKDVVFPYKPNEIIIYCGENDLASSDTVSAKTVYNRFRQLFSLIRNKFPNVPVMYISMKPSPSRQLLLGKMREGNALIQNFLKTKKQTGYIDVYKEMIDDEGKPRPELFVEDNLHMNKSGYAIWKKAIEPYLKK
jgi:lysophospholipase L1-like esterase